jgi:hypothetical protein
MAVTILWAILTILLAILAVAVMRWSLRPAPCGHRCIAHSEHS